MAMSIGELAQRLRVTTRTLRHYDQLDLLPAHHVDPATGYRTYTHAELLRGVHIAQLKAAGLSLDDIATILDDTTKTGVVLERHRSTLDQRIADLRTQLATTQALLGDAALCTPEIRDLAATVGTHMATTSTAGTLSRDIRRCVQQLRRRTRATSDVRHASFRARFPLDPDSEPFALEVTAQPEPTGPAVAAPEQCMTATWTGPHALLPLIYDNVLHAATTTGLRLAGTVIEHYHDIGPIPRTTIALPVRTDASTR